jgi:shikimate kinase
VINAISNGVGSAFAIDLRVKSTVELTDEMSEISGKVGDTDEDSKLIEICVEKVLEKNGLLDQYGAKVKTTTDLPIAVGLSSSSAAANATVLATYSALEEEPDPMDAIDVGIEAAFEAETTITGAFDDASASYLGNGVVTDNEKNEILRRFEVPSDLLVLIYIPPERSYTKDVDVERTRFISELVEVAQEKALDGNIYGAQTVNGLLYSSVLGFNPEPALEALSNGAESSGLTGTGPAVVTLAKEENVESIINGWNLEEGKVIKTRPSEMGARIENE